MGRSNPGTRLRKDPWGGYINMLLCKLVGVTQVQEYVSTWIDITQVQ